VLSIHGLVSQSFKNNNSFGYNMLVGARGGGMQLTMNTVYYLSQPVENIPYEYYLAFVDQETRSRELKTSLAFMAMENELSTLDAMHEVAGGPGGLLVNALMQDEQLAYQSELMGLSRKGIYTTYTDIAVPLCLGDYWQAPGTDLNFRCVGTNPNFFEKLVLDIDTREKFKFAEGRNFENINQEHGYFECVVGSQIAKRGGVKLGDILNPTHGDPNSSGAHLHEQGFTVVGILDRTGTPNDRVVFLNMEGFYLMEDHVKPIEDDSLLGTTDNDPAAGGELDLFADEETGQETDAAQPDSAAGTENPTADGVVDPLDNPNLKRLPLPIEQREVTSILVSTSSKNDPYGILAMFLPAQINQGDLETTLKWSPFRPVKAQTAAQAVNPVDQVTSLFALFVDPVRWLLLALTTMICVVSAISILVGIYNSMSQRQHEIAVMRALGASRSKVMSIMLIEAILLACLGGFFGWIAGHALNASVSPIVESRTGVPIGFFDFAPAMPLGGYLGNASSFFPEWFIQFRLSPELLLIPGLIILAVVVGVYPAISAYRTDVANSLGK
jgi:putative ABC transport system permease protein